MMRLNAENATREPGFSLIEMLIALGILGIIGVAFALALSGALWADDLTRERVTSENLARAQLIEAVLPAAPMRVASQDTRGWEHMRESVNTRSTSNERRDLSIVGPTIRD